MKNEMLPLRIIRLLRTQSSDAFVIFDENGRIGHLHVHYGNVAIADLILEKKLSQKYKERLFDYVHELVDDIGVEDVIFSAFVGKEVYSSSKTKDWSEEPVTRSQFKQLEELVSKQAGRYSTSLGKLIEKATAEYFSTHGYECRSATPAEDEAKIDVIASSEKEVILIQCKAGSLSYQKTCSYVNKMLSSHKEHEKTIRIAFVCKSFPRDVILPNKDISSKFNTDIIFLNVSDIVHELPSYRQMVG